MIEKIQSLLNHQGFIKYFKNISWRLMEKTLRMLVGFFVGIWVARYLGPDQFGLLSYAQSFIGLFVVVAKLGLDSIVIRELVVNKKNTDELIGTVFFLKLFGFILVIALLFISLQFTSNNDYTNILVYIIAGSIMFQSFNVIDFYFQSKVISKYIVLVNIVSLFISSIMKVLFILNEAPLIFFALIILFDSIIVALGFIYVYAKKTALNIQHWKFNRTIARRLLKDSWPLIISGVSMATYIQIDQVMIKEMLGNSANGQYAAAARLNNIWYFIPMIVTSSLFPAIINAKHKNEKLYYERLQKLYTFLAIVAVSIAIPVTLFSDWMVDFVYGAQYHQAASVFMILIWTGLALALGLVWRKWIINENKQLVILYMTLLGIVINIVFNKLFIESYGINGAAIATLISFWISTLLGYALYKPLKAFKLFFNSFNFMNYLKQKED